MAKQKKTTSKDVRNTKDRLTANQVAMTRNALLRRWDLIQSLLSPGHDIDTECGYPSTITKQNYKTMYDRTGVAARVVEILPEECWSMLPAVYEQEDAQYTEFEKEWLRLDDELHLFSYLNRIDILSGIGQFGLLLFGIGDGKALDKPVDGIDLKTGRAKGKNKYPLLYMRAYDESVIEIAEKEADPSSPRYSFPTYYNIEIENLTALGKQYTTQRVHWTRVLHVADNRMSSEIYGIPRMQKVYNNLLDLRKVLGGSGEMFWKGGFPGIAFNLNSDAGLVAVSDDAKTTMKDNIDDYFAGLNRALLLENVDAKPMTPQVADPSGHIEMQVKAIAISLGVPYRIFQGSEEAKQASTQDKRVWNERIMKRQRSYLTPMLIRPFVDRLIAYGSLPAPAQYIVEWPDREASTDKDVAEVAVKEVQAMSAYVQGEVFRIMSPKDFYISILKKSAEEAEAFENNVNDTELDLEVDEEEENKQTRDVSDDNNTK